MLQKAPRLQRRKVESLARLVTEPLLLASLVRSHLLGAELVGDLHEAVHGLHHACVGTSGERSEVAGAVFAASAVLCVAGLEPLRLFSTVEVPRQQLRRLLDLVGHLVGSRAVLAELISRFIPRDKVREDTRGIQTKPGTRVSVTRT